MPDLGHEPTFGIFLPNPVSQSATVVRLAHLAEQHGLDLLGVQDHPYSADLLETWTLLAHLAGSTGSIRLFPDVACVPLRPPAMLARAAATLDVLSGGRVELGVGAGAFTEPIVAMGGPTLTPGESVDALAEAIRIIRMLWSADDEVSFDGRFHRVADLAPGPRPAHDIGVWIGGHRPRMLRLVAQLGDGWVPSQAYVPRHRATALAAGARPARGGCRAIAERHRPHLQRQRPFRAGAARFPERAVADVGRAARGTGTDGGVLHLRAVDLGGHRLCHCTFRR